MATEAGFVVVVVAFLCASDCAAASVIKFLVSSRHSSSTCCRSAGSAICSAERMRSCTSRRPSFIRSCASFMVGAKGLCPNPELSATLPLIAIWISEVVSIPLTYLFLDPEVVSRRKTELGRLWEATQQASLTMPAPGKDLVAQQRAAAAKEKQRQEAEKLKKENPALAKQKERQEAKLKAVKEQANTPKGKKDVDK